MKKKNVIKCVNCDLHKYRYEAYNKMVKKMIKTIPKTELVNILIGMKIIKEDYLTKEHTLNAEKFK